MEVLSALSTGKKKKVMFFKGDAAGTPIGAHTVCDFNGEAQSVGMVQTWNQCQEMLLTSQDKGSSILLMDTETGQTKSELSVRREQASCHLQVESVAPMQKFEQYRQSREYALFGVGDDGHTIFGMNHDSRSGKNVEEFVIKGDSCRKYKSRFKFTCHAQTKTGFLVLGRSDGAVALYDAIMKSENSSCVIDGMPGPVTSIDVAADGSMVAWTTPEFCFFTCLRAGHWAKGVKEPKPRVLKLAISPADHSKHGAALAVPDGAWQWTPVKFDAATARDEDGLVERELVSYCGAVQLRWNVRHASRAWSALSTDDAAPAVLHGVATHVGSSVYRHMTVKDDLDIVALEGEIVKSLHIG